MDSPAAYSSSSAIIAATTPPTNSLPRLQLLKKRKPKKSISVILTWVFSLALLFCLIQTFTYDPPYSNKSFIPDNVPTTRSNLEVVKKSNKTEVLARRRRRRRHRTIKQVLEEADLLEALSKEQMKLLPSLDESFDALYGPWRKKEGEEEGEENDDDGPVIYGLESCEAYRAIVPDPRERYVAPAGMFNSGTNNFERIFKNNFQGVNFYSHQKGTVIWQVPWGKHRMERKRLHHSAPEMEVMNQTNCLPVVVIRDPYHWMQSMCKERYSAEWKKSHSRCPNLVASEEDKKRWEEIQVDKTRLRDKRNADENQTTFQVVVYYDENDIVYHDSLVDLWNDWHRPYWENKLGYPRLMIRYEDMLLHAPKIVEKISQCSGIPVKKNHRFEYQKSTAKDHGSNTTFLTAIMRTSDTEDRQKGLSLQDKLYAANHLDHELMQAFRYRVAM